MKKGSRVGSRPSPWILGVGVLLLVVLAAFVQYVGPQFSAAVIQSEIVALTNTERTQSGAGNLTENGLLDKAAQAKANDMASKGYFSHKGPDGAQPWSWIEAAGYDYKYAGENLAVRFTASQEVVHAWMESPTHRANIVKAQYSEVGVGIADGTYQGEPTTFVVQFFASPAKVVSENPPSPKEILDDKIAPLTPPTESFATPTTNVAGAEVSPPSWWERLLAYISTTLSSLTASVAESDGANVLIDSGAASTVR